LNYGTDTPYNERSGFEYLVQGLIGLITLAVLLTIPLGIGASYTDRSEKATALAGEHLSRLGIEGATTACQKYDTDGDGYISCDYSTQDQDGRRSIEPLECAPGFFFEGDCRVPKMSVRAGR
jgi:hypothetical protein